MTKSSRLEKDKKIEDYIIKDVKTILMKKKEIDDTTIKDVRNLFRLNKEMDDTTVKDIVLKKKTKQLQIE